MTGNMAKVLVSMDVEADGPCPGLYSMVSFGAVVVERGALNKTFYSGLLQPISEYHIPEALAISGVTRDDMRIKGRDSDLVMIEFDRWLKDNVKGSPVFIADNNGFDWQFINYYFHKAMDKNPFGFSSQNINSLYKGLSGNMFDSFKHLRKTKHTHNPVDDAKGNAEALLEMANKIKGIV